jgi:hypothetical protein
MRRGAVAQEFASSRLGDPIDDDLGRLFTLILVQAELVDKVNVFGQRIY